MCAYLLWKYTHSHAGHNWKLPPDSLPQCAGLSEKKTGTAHCSWFHTKYFSSSSLPTIIANITGILYTLKHILRAIIKKLRAEISFVALSVQVLLTTYKSSGLKFHFQPTTKVLRYFLPEEHYRVFIFSLLHMAYLAYVCIIVGY